MPTAILLLCTAIGAEKTALKRLRQLECVKEAYRVQSVYDIVVKVKTETFDKFSSIISNIKQILPKPHHIVTMVIVEN